MYRAEGKGLGGKGVSLGMKIWVLCMLLGLGQGGESRADTLRVLFWNVENFFDTRADTTRREGAAFSAGGERHWGRKKFRTKCQAVAKTILWTASEKGGLPDIIGLAEVENAFVLKQLIQTTALRKLDYRVVHFESPDPRGIDAALLYRSSRLRLESAKPCHLYQADSTVLPTRDILLASFLGPGGELSVLVNHHPSKFGGVSASESRRRIAVERLRQLADSLTAIGRQHLVAMGDFNDTPDNPLFQRLAPTLVNLAQTLHNQGKGTIKYEGKWELIDLFFVSGSLLPAQMEILQVPFLQTPDSGHAGTKPLRTYSGPRYLGGVSDHCPIWLTLTF